MPPPPAAPPPPCVVPHDHRVSCLSDVPMLTSVYSSKIHSQRNASILIIWKISNSYRLKPRISLEMSPLGDYLNLMCLEQVAISICLLLILSYITCFVNFPYVLSLKLKLSVANATRLNQVICSQI